LDEPEGREAVSHDDRYQVYTSDRTPELREIVGDDPHYFVWDRELSRSVPFGGYGSADAAQRRAYRMNHPTGWDTGSQRLCLPCADAYAATTIVETEGGNRTGWVSVQGTVAQACAWCGASLSRTDRRVKSCGAFADHDPHPHGTADLRCPGNGPFRDSELAKLEPETHPGPPCVCSDSIRSRVGHCPSKDSNEYAFCPVRRGRLKRNGG
jgi:hypothetical protein